MKNFQDRYSSLFRRAGTAEACPSAEALVDLSAGRGWPWQRRRLVGHLAHCSDCADDFRVLTAARGGLTGALEDLAHESGGAAARWLRPGLVGAAAVAVLALGASVLVNTFEPGPGADPGPFYASHSEPAPGREQSVAGPDRLFASDFGESDGAAGILFRDDFGA